LIASKKLLGNSPALDDHSCVCDITPTVFERKNGREGQNKDFF
jgi:hypothetical protein